MLNPTEANALGRTQAPPRGVRNDRGVVLVAEDVADTLDTLTAILKSAGYRVIGARDGLNALELFERERPDVVLLDLDLPAISGFRLLQLLRKHQPWPTPVIVVTGYDYEEAVEVAQYGVADLITKPFDARELLSRIELALCRAKHGSWPTSYS